MTDKTFIVTEAAKRPALPNAASCFYCQQPIGDSHKSDCVLVKRKVTVRMVVEYEIEVPAHWDKEQIEFHRNRGSWCSDNAMDELEQLQEADGCLCARMRFALVRDAGEPFLVES
jgi:hypothetical protein